MKKILTIILDGFGYSEDEQKSAIKQAQMPNYDKFYNENPHTLIKASEEAVGLPKGQFGNSEVGHLTIGAGKILRQKLLIAQEEIAKEEFRINEAFEDMVNYVIDNQKDLHLMGLISDGGVHSHISYILDLLKHLKKEEVPNVYIHVITDGRDTPTTAALNYINVLQEQLNELHFGSIATICGRYYAMDRDNRWDRTHIYYELVTQGKGTKPIDLDKAFATCYQKGATDEFIPPLLLNKNGLIKDEDALLWLNIRTDRAKQILEGLTSLKFDKFIPTVHNLRLYTLFEMDKALNAKIFFEEEKTTNPLGIYLSKLGLTQARIAETEKYNHVTKFFDGEYTGSIKGCDKFLIPSPKVATYDLKPEMSAIEVSKKTILCLQKDYDFILVNFANPDMLGHTGKIPQTVMALQVVDACLGKIFEAAEDNFYTVILLADHGNCDVMLDENNNVVTTHSINKVPFIINDSKVKLKENGNLSNVAPTILKYMDIALPEEMKETPDLIVDD
mgnify:CR=1 FL=1